MLERLRGWLAAPHWAAWVVRYVLLWQIAGLVAIVPVFAIILPIARLIPGGAVAHPLVMSAATVAATLVSALAVYLFIRWFFRVVDRRDPCELAMGIDRRTLPMTIAGMIFAIALLAAVAGVQWALGWISLTANIAAVLAKANELLVLPALQFIGVAVSEELRYRAYAFASGRPALPDWLVVTIIGLVWGLMHSQYEAFGALSVVNLLILSFAYFAALRLTGGVWFGVGFHFMWDFGQASLIGLAFAGDGAALISVEQNGPELWVGGRALIEAGLLYTALFAILAIAGWAKVMRRDRAIRDVDR